jgi:predicted  nucleic acid-binding Zn-ribbon protein
LAGAKKLVADQLAQLAKREENLKKEQTELQSNRGELAGAVDDSVRSRYERLARSKGENVVVGVNHAVCGGCHMKLPPQILVACRAEAEIVTCSNCGRILYYTREMNLAAVE